MHDGTALVLLYVCCISVRLHGVGGSGESYHTGSGICAVGL